MFGCWRGGRTRAVVGLGVAELEEGSNELLCVNLMPVAKVVVVDHFQFKRSLELSETFLGDFACPVGCPAIPSADKIKPAIDSLDGVGASFDGNGETLPEEAWNGLVGFNFAEVADHGFEVLADHGVWLVFGFLPVALCLRSATNLHHLDFASIHFFKLFLSLAEPHEYWLGGVLVVFFKKYFHRFHHFSASRRETRFA